LQEERAIVSSIAGTTRDTVEEVMNVEGILFRFIDTAGIREHAADEIEEIGIRRSREKAASADIVIYVHDLAEDTEAGLAEARSWLDSLNAPFLVLLNKTDVPGIPSYAHLLALPDTMAIVAREGIGISTLKEALVARCGLGEVHYEGTLVTNRRHFEALRLLEESLLRVQEGLGAGIPADLIALDIRTCLQYLGEITGEVTTEDKLDYIFSKFCIGK
jgi:tRNA modification GTPase